MIDFRTNSPLFVLKDSIYSPKNYRYQDAIDLDNYIKTEDELQQDADEPDCYDDTRNSTDVYCSTFIGVGFRSPVKMHAKPSIIDKLTGRKGGKQNYMKL